MVWESSNRLAHRVLVETPGDPLPVVPAGVPCSADPADAPASRRWLG